MMQQQCFTEIDCSPVIAECQFRTLIVKLFDQIPVFLIRFLDLFPTAREPLKLFILSIPVGQPQADLLLFGMNPRIRLLLFGCTRLQKAGKALHLHARIRHQRSAQHAKSLTMPQRSVGKSQILTLHFVSLRGRPFVSMMHNQSFAEIQRHPVIAVGPKRILPTVQLPRQRTVFFINPIDFLPVSAQQHAHSHLSVCPDYIVTAFKRKHKPFI